MLVFAALTQYMEFKGLLWSLESAAFDTLLRLAPRPRVAREILVIQIDENDYLTRFDRKSPLDCATLGRLIERVASKGPPVIGIDLDTSACSYPDLAAANGKRIIWGVNATAEPAGAPLSFAGWFKGHEQFVIRSGTVLGQGLGELPAERAIGVPVFPLDRDGLARRFFREVEIEGHAPRSARPCHQVPPLAEQHAGSHGGHPKACLPTLSYALYRAHCGRKPCGPLAQAAEHEFAFNFRGYPARPRSTSAGSVLDATDAQIQALFDQTDVVILGGSYQAARDLYLTPAGPISGVELNARALLTDLHGRGIGEIHRWAAILLDMAAGHVVFLVFLLHRWSYRRRFWLSVAAAAGGSLLFSLLLFRTSALWASFIGVFVGTLIHQLYEALNVVDQEMEKARHAQAHPPAGDAPRIT